MDNLVYIWIAIILITVILEAATMQLTCIWFTFGALAAWLISLCGGPLWLQLLIFSIISILLLAFTRPLALKYLKPKTEKTNADAVPGKIGVVVSPVRPVDGVGQVKVEGLIWSAKPEDGIRNFEIGERIEVVRIEGVKLVIRPYLDTEVL